MQFLNHAAVFLNLTVVFGQFFRLLVAAQRINHSVSGYFPRQRRLLYVPKSEKFFAVSPERNCRLLDKVFRIQPPVSESTTKDEKHPAVAVKQLFE